MSLFSNFRFLNPVELEKDLSLMTPKDIMFRKALRHTGFKFGLFLLLLLAFIGIFVPFFVDISPYDQDITNRLLPPVWSEGGSWKYVFGTDGNGRDYLARIIYGTRISLTIGIGAAFVGMIIGVTLGVIAGYFGGVVDQVINYILTCQLALPGILFLLTIISIVGSSVTVVILVIGVLHWTLFLVVTRAATQRIRNLDYVTAAQAIGASRFKIIFHDIIPNVLNQIIVIFTLEVGIAILSESAISFLGVGLQPPTPSWGVLIAEGKEAIFFQPWLIILPGIALFLLVISINMVGDGLRDITDPNSSVE
jgi:peptide/nickel transport system permease protein|tara:strand:+ start:2717 stop:3640 length:924 start_codon:yes stop_codon:yes gene_type:complete